MTLLVSGNQWQTTSIFVKYLSSSVNNSPSDTPAATAILAGSTALMPSLYARLLWTWIGTCSCQETKMNMESKDFHRCSKFFCKHCKSKQVSIFYFIATAYFRGLMLYINIQCCMSLHTINCLDELVALDLEDRFYTCVQVQVLEQV